MGFLDRLLGRDKDQQGYQQAPGQSWGGQQQQQPSWGSPSNQGHQGNQGGYQHPGGFPPAVGRPGAEPGSDAQADQAAIARYRYMLKTAPPERIEEAHAEAFAKLSPDQRRMVLAGLSEEVPPHERATSDDPRSLARMATRAEMRSPGTLERSFNRPGLGGGMGGGGMGMGGMIAGGLLAGVAGAFVGTAIADAMFDGFDGSEFQEGYEAAADDFTQQGDQVGQQVDQGQQELGEAGDNGFDMFGGGDGDFSGFGDV
ncbi:hypothetical protein GCM10022223_26490 [Kineosporia mesophila]|uniref:Uncharacterized protein n=1 Tax=Kineosporia mesophila TaxID=566012 RepID=A0ABP6ZGR1_9ACTN|nr:hypothetical protein [Kineosporia mesophila]MCD5350470.1 hypothetical protein [Kineosporia mesophila]